MFEITKHYLDEEKFLLFEQDLDETRRDWFNLIKIERF